MARLIFTDAFDEFNWRDAQQQSKGLREMIEEARAENPGFLDLLGDMFQLLHQPGAKWQAPKQVTMHEHLLREISETREFQDLRAMSENDLFNATMGTEILGRKILPRLGDNLAKRLEEEYAALRELEEAKALEETIQTLNADPNADPAQIAQIQQQIQNMTQHATSILIIEIDFNSVKEAVSAVRREVRNAVPQAVQQIEEMQELQDILGEGNRSMETQLRLVERINSKPNLRELFQLAGRLRRVARQKRASVVKTLRHEVIGVTIGSDVNRAIASELALLQDPATALIFAKKMCEGQLLIHDMEGHEDLGRGPITLCIDGSGSMAMGGKIIWAKAVTLAFLAVAEDEKRDVFICEFGGHGQHQYFEFPYKTDPRTVTREKILKFAEYFMNAGNTDLQTPLDWSADQIVGGSARYADADIVMLTDAECQFDQAWLTKWSERRLTGGFKSFGVLIGSTYGMDTLKQAVQQAIHITDLTRDESVMDLLFAHD